MKTNIDLTDEQVKMLKDVIKDDNCRTVLWNYGNYMLHRGIIISVASSLCGYFVAEVTCNFIKLIKSKKSSK